MSDVNMKYINVLSHTHLSFMLKLVSILALLVLKLLGPPYEIVAMLYVMLIFNTVLSLFCIINAFPNIYPRMKLNAKPSKDVGEPLLLTQYLEKGVVSLAQNLSRVPLTDKMGIRSYAGFFTIDKQYNSNLYFWYFPPFSKESSAPVILWLQGGPGGSSLYGLFRELGPLMIKKQRIRIRKYHWALNYHLIFIDNPVGAGYSFTDYTVGYCSDQDCIAKGLYNALQQFFTLFPNLRDNDFYISGESYAGKYIPTLGMEIHNENAKVEDRINLKGMALGNAYCDPINQLDYGNYLYQHGLLDNNELKVFLKYQIDIYSEIKQENWITANMLMDRLMDGQVSQFSLFKFYTGYASYYNYQYPVFTDGAASFVKLLHQDAVRSSMHVGGRPFQDGEKVHLVLGLDMLKSVAPAISQLLSHYRIMFFNGQLDIVVAYPLTVNFLRNLNFSASEEYRKAVRHIWKVGKNVAGYIKRAGNLSEVLVRNAGHMVPKDRPNWALNLIKRFITNNY